MPDSFVPRLTMGNIYNSPFYTVWNAYYPTYRMPNCTAYAFGRFNELAQVTALNSRWPTGNGCDWFIQAPGKGLQTGQIPALGAAACWWYVDTEGDPSGHVAIVEQINFDSNNNPVSFVTSNSAWSREDPDNAHEGFPYFYLSTISMSNLDYVPGHPEAYFQGFVYHPQIAPPSPTPVYDLPVFLALILKRRKRGAVYR